MASRLKQFVITHIKPSRYDYDGYVIQWRTSSFPPIRSVASTR